ncbi:MAG: septal ring lytic transglycosylase RlpA family protein, partial [Treponema sp.]|nr:septal ring lytic transglycosylase RlpA family protein [Treponema sp.]
MKKFNIALIVLITALIFISASVWEGSAVVSAAGEFPDGAYYVATDSFPRNTVVDVTNLENGRTIRVIVTAGLDSPGLLAMLSRNAAFAIGLQSRGIGRIRMTQPSDPVAYSRFTEEGKLGGNPESAQSRAAPVVSSPIRTARVGDLVGSTLEDRFYSSIINKPETYNPPPVEFPSDGSVHTEALPTWLPGEGEPAPLIAEAPVPETIPDPV